MSARPFEGVRSRAVNAFPKLQSTLGQFSYFVVSRGHDCKTNVAKNEGVLHDIKYRVLFLR